MPVARMQHARSKLIHAISHRISGRNHREGFSEARSLIENYLPLIHGLIEAFVFLESSGPDDVDPHSAVRCMENISSHILELQHPEQLALRAHLAAIADATKDPAFRDFVGALPDMIGLAGGPI